ncbi:MAG: hypothetical protein ACKN9D_08965, partial [Actinomycetales bacterium]
MAGTDRTGTKALTRRLTPSRVLRLTSSRVLRLTSSRVLRLTPALALTLAAAVGLATALGLATAGAQRVRAEPGADLNEVRSQVRDLQHDAESASERYNQ